MTCIIHVLSDSGKIVSEVIDTEIELYRALCGLTPDELDAVQVTRGNYITSGADALEELIAMFGE